MPWFKVDDKLHEHDKAFAAGLEAMGLWVVAGSWSADNLKDGFVPNRFVSRWGAKGHRAADALVAAGLWACRSDPHGWQFLNWDEFQPTRADVEEKRQRARERMANVRANKPRTSPEPAENFAERSPYPVPTRPDPNPFSQSSTGDSGPDPQPVDDDIAKEAHRRALEAGHAGRIRGPFVAYRASIDADLRASGWKPPDPDFLCGTGKLNGKPDLPSDEDCVGPPEGLTRAGRHVHGRGGKA